LVSQVLEKQPGILQLLQQRQQQQQQQQPPQQQQDGASSGKGRYFIYLL
jgi:hypothetical protein